MMAMRIIFIALILACFAGPSLAQTAAQAEAPKPLQPVEKRIENDMIAMSDMVQALSRNLGQLHYLRTLCFGQSDQKWRNYAQEMMGLEAGGDSDRRRALIKAFNDGYYDQKLRFPECNDSVAVDAAALSENARLLAEMLADPYREN